ncbi:hypothetical protein H2201_008702 [Coniosporium apollinis]|uniref:Uncharacterized protein n=1 Tax=Coniosporium apollinis TaxID=61459 RepID=A0ABQ9NFJ3_9PEZI|nr:hypothetical protein H2201_008702 [Coniosporium apollinis]
MLLITYNVAEEPAYTAGSVQLPYEADDVDQATSSTDSNTEDASISNDGTEDQQASREDHGEHAADNQSDGVDREQHIRAAETRLKKAWAKHCTCAEPPHALGEAGHSLAEIARFWRDQISPFAPSGITNYPLDLPTIASRNEDPNDHRHIPWKPLLAGGDENPPKLSFQKSESRFKTPDIQISRRWDIDSFIAGTPTLAVHRGGFNLAFRPPYLQRITQNPRIRIQGHETQKLKQLRLGQGLAAGGFGYECHVLFPHMVVKKRGETHLSNRAQRVWIDHIVLPALKRSCPSDVYQHHPHSFLDADCKARVKQECFATGTGQAMDIRYVIPESYLDTFWAEVQRLSYEHAGDGRVPRDAFRNPVLVISGHGLKLFTKRDTLEQARNDFLSHLNQCFHFDTERLPPEDCWLDLGLEDTPVSAGNVNRGVTLLRKLHCLDSWAKKFACPDHASHLIKTDRYHWALTRDSGSAKVELRQTNSLRKKGGIAYNKAYNVNRELFATPLKGYEPFQNPQFEALGYSPDLLERWYSLNSMRGRRPGARKRQQLLAAYSTTKQRLSCALRKSEDEHYGVRQEYRITVELLRGLDGAEELERDDGANKHMPYWVLPTKEVNAFAAGELNRWLFWLEEEQLFNGMMVSAVVRILRMSAGTDPSSHPSLWLREWGGSKGGRRGRTEVSDDDGEGDGDDGHGRRDAKRFGLDLRTCVEQNGMAWFPVEPIHWNITPTFTSQAIKRLALAANAFQKSFRKTRNIQRLLSREDTMLQLFRAYLRESETAAIKVGAQLSIRSYIQEVLALLAERWTDGPRDPKERLEEFIARAKLEDEEASGLRGLSWVMVANLIGGPPRVVGVRQSKAGGRTRNGKAHFAQYNTGLWKDKVFALFAWDDERADAGKKRGWHNAAFRLLTRRLHSIVVEEVGDTGGRRFLDFLKEFAAHCLWAISQYDYDKLSVMYKASKHHSRGAREETSTLTPLERTNWLVPQPSAGYQSDFRAIQGHYSQAGRHLNRTVRREAQINLIRGLHTSRLVVHSSDDKEDRIPGDPRHYYGRQPELTRAAGFIDVLDGLIAEQEAESEEDVV